MADQFIISQIRPLPLFAYLSPPQLDAVASAFQQTRYLPGDRLYQQGASVQALYLFVSGAAQLLRVGVNNVEYEVGRAQRGDTLGESSLFQGEPQESSVLITQESVVLVLTRARFEAVLAAHPDIRAHLNIRREVMNSVQAQRERNIRPDETTILLTRRHPWAIAERELLGVVIFALFIGLAFVSTLLHVAVLGWLPWLLALLAFVIPLLLTIYFVFDWYNDYFIVTSQRVIHEQLDILTGGEQRDQALLTSVQNVSVSRRGPMSELIGYGDVSVYTVGNQRALVLDAIPAPLKVQQAIFNQIQRRKERTQGPEAIRADVDALLGGSTSNSPAQSAYFQPQNTAPRSTFTRVLYSILPPPRMEDGDRIIYHKHWMVLLGNLWKPALSYVLLAGLLVVRLSGRVAVLDRVSGLAVLGITLMWLLISTLWLYWGYASWQLDVYIIDSQSVIDIIRTPLLLRETRIQANLVQIQNVTSVIKNAWWRLFNVGSVVIQTAAEHGTMTFETVQNPRDIAEEILQRVQQFTEQKTNANQQEQRRLVAEYLSAYHQAAQRDLPPDQRSQSAQPPGQSNRANLDRTQANPPAADTYSDQNTRDNQPPRPPTTPR